MNQNESIADKCVIRKQIDLVYPRPAKNVLDSFQTAKQMFMLSLICVRLQTAYPPTVYIIDCTSVNGIRTRNESGPGLFSSHIQLRIAFLNNVVITRSNILFPTRKYYLISAIRGMKDCDDRGEMLNANSRLFSGSGFYGFWRISINTFCRVFYVDFI